MTAEGGGGAGGMVTMYFCGEAAPLPKNVGRLISKYVDLWRILYKIWLYIMCVYENV